MPVRGGPGKHSTPPAYVVELFVRGRALASMEAVRTVREVCEAHLPGGYRLCVVDVNQQPELVGKAGIIATPTMVRRRPGPVLRTVGRLTETRVLAGLGLGAGS